MRFGIRSLSFAAGALAVAMNFMGCSTTPGTQADRDALQADSTAAMQAFYTDDATLQPLIKGEYGYAIFPTIGKGAVGVGGAYGHGEVFQGGTQIGWADVTQGSIGIQLGGQEYSELLVFQNKQALDQFTGGNFAFSANASAVAATAGAGAAAKFDSGVAVFVRVNGGLMYEASIGGQNFSFNPMTK